MGDRRVADRRAKEEGVIKIETKKAITILIISIIIIASLTANVILSIKLARCKETLDTFISLDYYTEMEDEDYNY